jgi:hypothetical protein
MKKMDSVDREILPDCCITCQELEIDEYTLVCNYDGCDVLPFCKCSEFKRLKFYGEHKTPLQIAV